MFHFIWVALLLTVAGAALTETTPVNEEKPCFTLSDTNLTAEAGLCAVVPCLTGANSDVSVTWHKADIRCDMKNNKNNTNNCRIIMKDLSQLDRGSYLLKISEVSQKPTVESSLLRAGHNATLTCTVLALSAKPVYNITWTWSAAGRNISHIEGINKTTKAENLTDNAQRHSSTLTFKASAEHHGTNVTCTVHFRDGSAAEESKTLSVSFAEFSGILNTSACQRQSDVLTCVCVSEGFPLPTITWPQLEKRTDYSVLTTVSNNTVKNTITVSEKTNSSPTFECVSSNGANEARRNLTVTKSKAQDILAELWRTIKQLEVIVAFLIGLLFGIIFSSFLTCLARKCRRQKQKPGRLTEDLEMNTHAVQMEVCHAAEHEGTEEAGMMAEAAGPSAPEGGVRPKEVEYSHIDFSLLKAKNPVEEDSTKGAAETEYAEIKKEIREEGEGNDGEGSEEMREDEGTQEDGGEKDTLYSNVKEIMDEM